MSIRFAFLRFGGSGRGAGAPHALPAFSIAVCASRQSRGTAIQDIGATSLSVATCPSTARAGIMPRAFVGDALAKYGSQRF